MTSAIAERLAEVRARIAAACARAGRDASSVALVAVSKTHDAAAVRAAYDAGQRLFGENYVQELVQKARALEDLEDVRWHFIGHLQRNKSKDVATLASCIETVDSVRLVDAIAKRADALGIDVDVLVQVDVAGEPQKGGCAPAELDAVIDAVKRAPTLRLRGLMTIPPLGEAAERSRPHFRALRELASARSLAELSMGMSADLEIAIEEGATLVRVGTAIFGARG
ncbi:MAG: YggS family pyridoxal phosphate-dependent enzyme [Myxococcota bacterium]|nr:YggS family pyridoxal phosphate-dependent enzyme [Myxococcota bacterium]